MTQQALNFWVVFALALAASVVAEPWVSLHPHFAIESVFAFYALFGLASCVLMVVVAKAVGLLLARPDTYYDEQGGARE
ncbi:MAG TPA: hypothetical protein PLQ67_02890 [Burkholderiaceae bacterium]|nr:hypothetical protein [Burkholderiaceae bacterium]